MKNSDKTRPPAKQWDTDGFVSKRTNNIFRKTARPHEKHVFDNPQIGNDMETIDSAQLLIDKD